MTSNKIFTAWFTSESDGVDHAVTDEEFTEHRPEPEAVCGALVALGPLESSPGPRCPRCVAFLAARMTLRDLDRRFELYEHRRSEWWGRLLRRCRLLSTASEIL
ncbi:hypothetical protein [Kutzneria sp. NPDC052558]|uniref:hypothetical protein n=1 Tax=Kutzneria sp. NPDC052558 TaxID=3364121 RepID=UPI0037C50A56